LSHVGKLLAAYIPTNSNKFFSQCYSLAKNSYNE